jgi:hypothetical protein
MIREGSESFGGSESPGGCVMLLLSLAEQA